MNHCSWLAVALGVLVALAGPASSSPGESGPSNPDVEAAPSSKLEQTCYFGEPSESCAYACSQKSLDAYCDVEKKQCLCKELEDKEDQIEKPEDHERTNFRMHEICVFDYPSPPCISHCQKQLKIPHCDKDMGKCVCQESKKIEAIKQGWSKLMNTILAEEEEEFPNTQNLDMDSKREIEAEALDLAQHIQHDLSEYVINAEQNVTESDSTGQNDTNHLVFYVFDLGPLLNETEETTVPNTTAFSSTHSVFRRMGKDIEGWAFSHVMATIFIVFLVGLVLIELAFCFKKPDNNRHIDGSIFPTKK